MKRLLSFAVLGVGLLAATSAFAHEGYVTGSVILRAGPDYGYPSVLRLHRGTPVEIEGCVDDWSWCDVSLRDERGWVPGAYLQQEYDGRRVLIRDYGVRIGVPIVSFTFGDYWDSHYRSRSWYGHRDRWSHVRPRYYQGGSYGHSGGSYGHSGSAYSGSHDSTYRGSRDTRYRDSHQVQSRDTYAAPSSGYRSGDGTRRSGTVTTQSTYEARQSVQPAYRTVPSRTAAPRRELSVDSQTQQTYINSGSPAVHNANPQRSASGQEHSAAGQQRAAEVHQRNAERAQQRGHDQSDNDHRGRKDKEKDGDNGNDGKGQH